MSNKLRVLYFIEGFTDIRWVVGLSQISKLSMAVPKKQYHESGLKERIQKSGIKVTVDEIPGGRLVFQFYSFLYLIRKARFFDVILSQEMQRGSLNANLVGLFTRTPVVTYVGILPVEYFRCRYERKQIGFIKVLLGEYFIRFLLRINGYLTARCVAIPAAVEIMLQYCPRTHSGAYYGVNTDYFRPINNQDQRVLRRKLELPEEKFIIFFASRISHEKDPETVLHATALARLQGLDAVLLNLGGGFSEFIQLSKKMNLDGSDQWIIGRPAVHPMTELAEYYQAIDIVAQASLAEGACLSTLEALSCGIPVAATAVGGLKLHLDGFARLSPRSDPVRMCNQFLWIANHPAEAKAQALKGREYVIKEWNNYKAFLDLQKILEEEVSERKLRD